MNYSLSNFKIFSGSEPHTFELAPITMLIGENNSGKSTITKSLLLFQDFFDKIRKDFINGYFKSWDDYVLDFTVGDHKLGSYENVLPFTSENEEIKVGYSMKSEVLAFCKQACPKYYDVEITFIKNQKDTTSKLCLQAKIKEIIIRINKEEFYSYKNNKEKINITPITAQYIEILNSIYNQSLKRERLSNSFRAWFNKNSRISSWKYQRLLERFIMGGRYFFGDERKTILEKFAASLFPIRILSQIENLNPDNLEQYINDNIHPQIEELRLGAAIEGTAKAHLRWIVTDFRESGTDRFGVYYHNLEVEYLQNITNLIVDHSEETTNLIYQPWSDIIQKPTGEVQKDLTRALKFEYVITLLSMTGQDDFSKHFFVQNIRSFVLLLLGEVFLQNDKLVDFVHLGLDRAGMQRLYTFKSQGNGFNRILANYMQQQPNIHFDLEKTFSKGDFMRKWLSRMTKFNDINFDYAAEGEGVYISLKEKDNNQTLADVGYGMTPLVAIMIQIELAILQMGIENHRGVLPQWQNSKTTIIIEEPESNLHPNYQAKLADLFVDAYKEYGIEFILETHSEYLARRMQVIVKEKGIEKENIIIHNLKDGQDREIRIKEDGNLFQRFWPGFYSESTSLISDLL